MLVGQHRQAPIAHPGDVSDRAGIAFDGAALAGGIGWLGLRLLARPFGRTEPREHAWLALLTGSRETQALEDPARLFLPGTDDLCDPFANADPAPLGDAGEPVPADETTLPE